MLSELLELLGVLVATQANGQDARLPRHSAALVFLVLRREPVAPSAESFLALGFEQATSPTKSSQGSFHHIRCVFDRLNTF